MVLNDSAQPGILYVVATPIGHLDDLTKRASNVLTSVQTVLAEDTRVTAQLLRTIGARPESLLSSDQYREASRVDTVLERLRKGESVAVVADAGTPGISDPGAPIVAAVRAAGFQVVPVPGCSALATLISVSGLDDGRFVFEGFLPASNSGRAKRLERLLTMQMSVMFYEAPHRIREFAESLVLTWGVNAQVLVGRELTKVHEEIWQGTSGTLIAWLDADPFRTKGEFAILVAPAPVIASSSAIDEEASRWLKYLVAAVGTNSAAKIAVQACGISRDSAYQLALSMKNSDT